MEWQLPDIWHPPIEWGGRVPPRPLKVKMTHGVGNFCDWHPLATTGRMKRRVSILMDMNTRMLLIIIRGCFSQPLQGMQSQCESGMTMGRRKSLHHLLKDTLLSGSMMN